MRFLNYIVIKVDENKANKLKGLIIDSDWGYEGKHMTHDGIVIGNGTNLDVGVGSTVWFDHRFTWIKDRRFNSIYKESPERGVFYYFLTEHEYTSYVRVCNDSIANGYVGIKKNPRKEKTESGIFIPQTVKEPDDRGVVIMGDKEIPEGSNIIYAEDNDYPSNEMESEWIQREGKNVIFTHKDYIFATYKGDELTPFGDWNLMEALDEDDEWENFNGLYIPRKEKAVKGLGKVVKSKKYKTGDKLIYAKRGYNSFEFNKKKYYAVKTDNILASVK